MNKGVLIIMVRAPRFGAVKTRLALDIGRMKAWQFYRITLTETVRRLRRGPWKTVIQVTPDREMTTRRQWPHLTHLLKQGRGDIGTRMERGLTSFPRGIPVVLIGSDIPGVSMDHINNAFRTLGHADAVFGPAKDGGYWLVGFANRRPVRDPFHTVRWSTQHALKDTQTNLRHLRVTLVDELSDVDDGESYARLRR
ncbi:MAG: TIGR04282 family arsenosugar biosynthesis glycosyltransferase [Rhodospirillaceae bacterium]|nr:TIGR04282 family arsenosugar biosynthesis glycosyltransferase [Rhodospirillaceae bacterium]